MLKKILTTVYLLTLNATPVQALPIWAEAIARSQCEYLALGVDWEAATDQALRDNEIWADEFLVNKELSAKAVVAAAYQLCPALYSESFQRYERQKSRPTFNAKPTKGYQSVYLVPDCLSFGQWTSRIEVHDAFPHWEKNYQDKATEWQAYCKAKGYVSVNFNI